MKVETHKYKRALAKRMMTRNDIGSRKSPFDTVWWASRKDKRSDTQLEQMDAATMRREARRADNLARHQEYLEAQKND